MIKTTIEGETFVGAFDNEYGKTYTVQLSSKSKEGKWENGYIKAQFKKEVTLENGCKINIKNAWLTFYKSKENKTVPYVFVNDFEIIESEKSNKSSANFETAEDVNVPF